MTELRKAPRAERQSGQRKLFPVRLVDMETIKAWECFDADGGHDLAVELRQYLIPDFSRWKEHDQFEASFARLLKDLKAETPVGSSLSSSGRRAQRLQREHLDPNRPPWQPSTCQFCRSPPQSPHIQGFARMVARLDHATKPLGETTKPLRQIVKPFGETTKPLSQTAKPLGETAKRLSQTAKALGETAEPLSQTAEPLGETAEPLGEIAEPLRGYAEPIGGYAEPLLPTAS